MSDTPTTPGPPAATPRRDVTSEAGGRLTDPPVTGRDLLRTPVLRREVVSWALWDWATQPFNTVILTFVFTALYLTSDAFVDPAVAALAEGDPVYEQARASLTSALGAWITVAGILVAVLAPVLGQRADVSGRRKAWLGGGTVGLVVCMLALFLVRADPAYFVVGAVLVALGSVAGEVAGVNYNAMLVRVSTKDTVGRVSGLGWGLGYIGGIVALALVLVANEADWWGMPADDGLRYRVVAVGCAVWALIFAWPLFRWVPEAPPSADRPRVGFLASYRVLARDVVELYRGARPTFWFLLASAVYRDGLAGVFTFGAVIASVSFRFSSEQVIVFGIAANLVAGLSTIAVGRLDDRLGPRAVILGSLTILVLCGLALVVLRDGGAAVFWVFGLLLSACVGPAQAASRSFLARVTPAGRESEIFGLYATTGRAASFVAPALWTLLITLTGATIWGTLGIVAVLLAGLLLMVPVRLPRPGAAAPRP